MAPFLLLALALSQAGAAAAGDTATYRDPATAALVTRAAVRHREYAARLRGYQARVRSRMEGSVATSRFGSGLRVIGIDLIARVGWQRPADVRVELLGARTRVARLPGARRESLGPWFLGMMTEEPWFAPGAMGDQIDFMGIPDDPALHPLAPGADRIYRYAVTDSVITLLPTRRIRTVAVSVEPREYDRSLVRGTMWLDADSLDVVRLSVAFVGPGLWEEDDDESPRLVAAEADLEYALHLGRFWLPSRQILTLDWRYATCRGFPCRLVRSPPSGTSSSIRSSRSCSKRPSRPTGSSGNAIPGRAGPARSAVARGDRCGARGTATVRVIR